MSLNSVISLLGIIYLSFVHWKKGEKKEASESKPTTSSEIKAPEVVSPVEVKPTEGSAAEVKASTSKNHAAISPSDVHKESSPSEPADTWFGRLRHIDPVRFDQIRPIKQRSIHGTIYDCYRVPRHIAYEFRSIPDAHDVVILFPHPKSEMKRVRKFGMAKYCISKNAHSSPSLPVVPNVKV